MTKKLTDNIVTYIVRRIQKSKRNINTISNTMSLLSNAQKTHYGLEKMILIDYLGDISNKCVMNIGISGSGKSTVLKLLNKNISRNSYILDTLTIGGLKSLAKKYSLQNISILVDDLSKSLTEYSQIHTLVILAELTYTGYFKRYTSQQEIEIIDYNGSAIVNIQPLLFSKIVTLPEYETDVKDKTIRYYHLILPQTPNRGLPQIDIKTQYGIQNVKLSDSIEKHELFENALDNFTIAYSKARALEHLVDLLKAHALLNNRTEVTVEDLYVIETLSKMFRLEQNIFYKESLEGERHLDPNVLPILTLIASKGKFNVKDLMVTFQLKKSLAYEIIMRLEEYVSLVSGQSEIIPKENTIELLKDSGILYEYS
jgi:ABC-type dipeptide/oligopeptide/nickel transport system ATPase subunit